MSEIKRYDKVNVSKDPWQEYCEMTEAESGEYVTYEDHQAKIKELESQLEQAKKDGLEAKQDQARYLHLRDKTLMNNEINDSLYVAIDSVHFPDSWAVVGSELDRAVDMAVSYTHLTLPTNREV